MRRALCALWLVSCNAEQAHTLELGVVHPLPELPASGSVFEASESVFVHAPQVRYVPASAPTVVAFRRPDELLARTGLDKLFGIAKPKQPFGNVMPALTHWASGIVSQHGEAFEGLDLTKPVVVSWFDTGFEQHGVYVVVQDRAAFRARLERAASDHKRELIAERIGDADVFRTSSTSPRVIVLHQDVAAFLYCDRAAATDADVLGVLDSAQPTPVPAAPSGACVSALADNIAHLSVNDALSGSDAFSQARDELAFGSDISVYLRSKSALARVAVRADAVATNASFSTEDHLARRAKQLHAIRDTIGDTVVGLELDPTNVRVKAFVAGSGGPKSSAFGAHQPSSGPLLLQSPQPKFAFAANVHPDLVVELLANVLGHDQLDSLLSRLASSGLGFMTEIAPKLSGQVGLTVVKREVRKGRGGTFGPDPTTAIIEGALVLGVEKRSRMRRLLRDWRAGEGAKSMIETGELTDRQGRWRIKLGLAAQDVWVKFEGDRLIVATSEQFLADLIEPKGANWRLSSGNATLISLADFRRPDGELVFDVARAEHLPRATHWLGVRSEATVAPATFRRAFERNTFIGGFSPGHDEAREERIKAIEELDGLRTTILKARLTGTKRLLTALGGAALTMRRGDDGLHFYGAIQLAEPELKNFAEWLSFAIVDHSPASEDAKRLRQVMRRIVKINKALEPEGSDDLFELVDVETFLSEGRTAALGGGHGFDFQ